MLKKIISLLILSMYLHGMSGYTMSFHKCMITGFENVYTGYGLVDPCNEEENACNETTTHFEQADCCDVQQTIISVDDDSNLYPYNTVLSSPLITQTYFYSYLSIHGQKDCFSYSNRFNLRPPDLSSICVFRI
jgi:hypothetical protein